MLRFSNCGDGLLILTQFTMLCKNYMKIPEKLVKEIRILTWPSSKLFWSFLLDCPYTVHQWRPSYDRQPIQFWDGVCGNFHATKIISLFPKEITVHSGIVWRDKIYSDRRQICERIEVSIIKINFLDDQKWNISFLH
jgi:hypothetical protein